MGRRTVAAVDQQHPKARRDRWTQIFVIVRREKEESRENKFEAAASGPPLASLGGAVHDSAGGRICYLLHNRCARVVKRLIVFRTRVLR